MLYDFITIWAWASGLFANINLPKKASKLLLEKNKILWVKVLMSWWERANFTNLNVAPEKYVSENFKAVIGFLNRFTQYDIINFFESHNVYSKIEDNWRVITASGHARDIVKVLVQQAKLNNTKIMSNCEVQDVKYKSWIYEVFTNCWNFQAKNIIVAVGGKSYPQVGTDGFGFELAKKFGLKVNMPYKGLVWMVTKENLADFSGTTIKAGVSLFENQKEVFYEEWNLLFTHWWVSGPTIYNAVLYGKYLDSQPAEYKLKIKFLCEDEKVLATKKLRKFFKLDCENSEIILQPNGLKSWKEAKVTAGGVDTNELTKFLESKKFPGLFFIWEVVDITGHTGGYNLQWAWSSAFCMSEKFS